ncbi:D-sedoheptulose-7-phosphate isomerase [Microbacterium trichothecenolyticum]|uniref:D-sedoheptulose 7-phosphate isomerase n=1 Tax=Microbacterium trichothecenolyticum TaxID=69370 RepID=A0ABU0TUJ0_MICTR|nr:SIS domain-containing protein [Microbacterium trichothecenolyticum]MDQ1122612.1 D-sedoheptulose 7-phosphate isomerase [Microbacterium trichothecenolyticum]
MTATAHPHLARPDIVDVLHAHVDAHTVAVDALRERIPVVVRWGRELADLLMRGQRLPVAGNGGSAAQAQHLTAEIVGRFDGERRPFSAISLHAESSSVTAIGNDYGFAEVFARQVHAHARCGDVVVLFSTSGRSENLLRAAAAADRVGARTWALTGIGPNPLADRCDEHIALAGTSAGVQEAHLLALHLLCRVFDDRVREVDARTAHAAKETP